MEIHDKIRVMREVNHWTQEDVAEKLGMSANGYSKIERGLSKPNLEKLQQIANIFNIDVIEFAEKEREIITLNELVQALKSNK